ncbi:MAG: OB-fold nucleic acid binding domain-containing protein [Merdibacter sp.]
MADGTQVRVAAIVSSRRLKSTRGGEMMAFVRLEDTSGGMEMLVFPKVLAQCSQKLVEGSVVVGARPVRGRGSEAHRGLRVLPGKSRPLRTGARTGATQNQVRTPASIFVLRAAHCVCAC